MKSLVLLNLSAAFDTVDHSQSSSKLVWHLWPFSEFDFHLISHLALRQSPSVSICAFSSRSCGVPQASVLGPLLYFLFKRLWLRWKSPFDRKKLRANCNVVRSLISKAKSIFFTNLVTDHRISDLQPSHTLGNFEFNSPPQSFQFTPWHTVTCQFIPPIFHWKYQTHPCRIFPISDSPNSFLYPTTLPSNLTNSLPTHFHWNPRSHFFFSKQTIRTWLKSTFFLEISFKTCYAFWVWTLILQALGSGFSHDHYISE